MKISSFGRNVIGGVACAGLLAASLWAQLPRANGDQQTTTARAGADKGLLDPNTSADSIRASVLMGMNIENSRQENVGKIQDIVLNASNGRIQYLAVTYGGFLGVGNKMFAVPYEAVEVRRDPDDPADPNDYVLVMNVTREQLDGAQGFDEYNWPNFADRGFVDGMYKRYNVRPRHEVLRVPHSEDGFNKDKDRR